MQPFFLLHLPSSGWSSARNVLVVTASHLSSHKVGYHVSAPCETCLRSCHNGHMWMFHERKVKHAERKLRGKFFGLFGKITIVQVGRWLGRCFFQTRASRGLQKKAIFIADKVPVGLHLCLWALERRSIWPSKLSKTCHKNGNWC